MGKTNSRLRSQECRLGLVMYGGISLAIYIFGVTQEFFNAVRGRGVYRLIKALTDSHVVVDIMSGTSAGGVNGILLSYALTNNLEFSECASLWRDAGDIAVLLRDPDASADEAHSVLNSERYQELLEQGLARMENHHLGKPSELEDVSPIQELDLFITGTDVHGRLYTWFDDQGHSVDVKDHRAVFLLKHREGRKMPFAPGSNPDETRKALATLARITSCFPVAFRPVQVKNVDPNENGSVDARLQHWGRLGKEAYFLDGGLLDNKPFTHTLKAIFYRLADHKVNRKMFYVEPDPEHFSADSPSEPSIVQAAIKSLVAIPTYESIADDLKLLGAHNEKVRRFDRLKLGLRMNGSSDNVQNVCDEQDANIYMHARLMEISERIVRGVLREDGHDVLRDKNHRDIAAKLFQEFDNWPSDGQQTLNDFDIFFRHRRLFHVLYSISDPEIGESEQSFGRTAQARVGRQIKLLEVISAAMDRLVDEAQIRWIGTSPEAVWKTVQSAYQKLLDVRGLLPSGYEASWISNQLEGKDWLNQKALGEVNAELRRRSTEICEELRNSGELTPPNDFKSVLIWTDACELRMLSNLGGGLRGIYDGFLALDAQVYPIETCAELGEKDIIDTVRISPFDAQRGLSKCPGTQKICGDELHHFGGFFKRSWRSNDIMWGRLDGLCQLVETLFTPERLEQVTQHDSLRIELLARLCTDLKPAALFPHSTPEVHRQLQLWFDALFSSAELEREQARAKERFNRDLSLLVEAAQLEVLVQDLPGVITDAVQQQAQWNQYRYTRQQKECATKRVEGSFSIAADGFSVTGPGKMDSLVVAAASEKLAELSSKNIADVKRFFRWSYRVGWESVQTDIPRLVLMETVAHILLALRNAITATAGDKENELRGHPANRWLGFFLRVVYGLSRFIRTTPKGQQFIFFAITLVSVQALWVGTTWWKEVIHPTEGEFYVRRFVALVLLPALALVAEAAWLWRRVGGLVRLGLLLAPLAALVWWREAAFTWVTRVLGW